MEINSPAQWSPDIYNKAWNFATLAHQGQFYGGAQEGQKIEYINHIGAVTMEVIWALSVSAGCDGNLAIQCALLHDVVEDTKYNYEDIKQQFGQQVADGVLALTKNEKLSGKEAQIKDSLQRIKLQPKEVWMVKLADRICNLQQPPYYWSNQKIISYQQEAVLIYDALQEANSVLAARLKNKIDNYTNFLKKANQ